MSFHDSWIAVQGVTPEVVLEELGLVESGTAGFALDVARPYAWGTTPDGWTLIYANFNGLAHIDNVSSLSRLGLVLSCDFQDQVDGGSSILIAVRDGEKLWEVSEADDDLFVVGAPPPEFAPIRDEYSARAREDPRVAWMCEVPIELGKQLCGFRHDEDESSFSGLLPRSDSSWHQNLKLAVHPKSQRPRERMSWRESFDQLRPFVAITLIIALVMAVVSFFVD